MIRLKEVIDSLRDNRIDAMVYSRASDIDTVAHVLEIDPHYLSVQVRIHLPYYEDDQLFSSEGIWVVRDILGKLRRSLDHFSLVQKEHRQKNGIDCIPVPSVVKESHGEIRIFNYSSEFNHVASVDEVPADLGHEIQTRMHYIHSPRTDTILHMGMFLEGRKAPICYAAFSPLDREYLRDAMHKSAGILPLSDTKIAVMTRAYGYNPLPKNAMSKLFDHAARKLTNQGYSYIITAVNPFLGFKGSIFGGSSFIPFCLSPMRYWYNSSGLYVNRRSIADPVHQKYRTPPIIWLARGLSSRTQRTLEFSESPIEAIATKDYDAK